MRIFIALLIVNFVIPQTLSAKSSKKKQKASPVAPASEPASLPIDVISSVYEAGDARDHKLLLKGESKTPEQIQATLNMLGRIGHKSGLPFVQKYLTDKNLETSKKAIFAAGLIGGTDAQAALKKLLGEKNQVTGSILIALAHSGADSSLIRNFVSSDVAEIRSKAAEALALVWSWNKTNSQKIDQKLADSLIAMIQNDDETGAYNAAYALTRSTDLIKLVVAANLKNAIVSTRAANPAVVPMVIRAYAKATVKVNISFLTTYLRDENEKIAIEAARSIGKSKTFAPTNREIEKFVKSSSPGLAVTVLSALKNPSTESWSKSLKRLIKKKSPWVGQEMVKAWARSDSKSYRDSLLSFIKGNNLHLKLAAIHSLGIMKSDDDIRRLMRLLYDSEEQVVAAALESLSLIPKKSLPIGFEKRVLGASHLLDPAVVYYFCEIAKKHKLKSMIVSLAENYDQYEKTDLVEARIAIQEAIVSMEIPGLEKIVDKGKKDPVVAVRRAASKNGVEVDTSLVEIAPISFNLVKKAIGTKYEISTSKGLFVIQLLEEAPYTSYNFAKLAADGFYDKRTFHRVVPNFVVQGGDPRGDGFGGPGYMIREEISELGHQVGAVGMATAGKDTGGSQFFVNLSNNVHLNGHYTVFAKVLSGMDNVSELEQGDSILKVKKL
jgi:cyclophilin family peptidyl-prolyl cis-trans isomerase/HEAT repeat protein